MTRTDWLTKGPPDRGVPLLVCVPHAGGTAGLFHGWADELAGVATVVSVVVPGRERRTSEAPVASWDELIDGIVAAVQRRDHQHTALFGHSMGAPVAFDVTRELERRGCPPIRLFISASASPAEVAARRVGVDSVDDAALVAWLKSVGGVPPEVLREPLLRDLTIAAVRTDLRLVDQFAYRAGTRVACPISAFGGIDDSTVNELEGWRDSTAGECTVRRLLGGHFYFARGAGRALLLDAIARDMASVAVRPR